MFIPIGVYDIASGTSGDRDECSRPYTLSLLVNSCVDDVLQLHSAQVTLRDIDRAVIQFDQNDTLLPPAADLDRVEDICPDNAGADGRMCVDDGC